MPREERRPSAGAPPPAAGAAAPPPAAGLAGDAAAGPVGRVPPDAARVWAAEQAAWELERTALRTRIAQLLAENKSLRLQLGQMHAASFSGAAALGVHGGPRVAAAPEPHQQSR